MVNYVKKKTLFLLVFIILSKGLARVNGTASQPNIIVIMADDMGWNDVGFHGSREILTPNIDALAYNGLILNRHYVLSTCIPSRTAFLTGRYPIETGLQGLAMGTGATRALPLKFKLLPEYLKDLGYDTKLLGKWHVGYFSECHTPTYRGFDTFFGYYNAFIQYYNHTFSMCNQTGRDLNYNINSSLNSVNIQGYFTDLITEEAEKIIKNHDTSRPLYLQVNHLAPHNGGGSIALEPRNATEMNIRFGYIKDINTRRYASVINSLDESVGRIITSLKDAGMLQNSIVLFTSDNGAQTVGLFENYGSNYPLRGLKSTNFDGGVRAVACLYSPLIKNNSRIVNQLIHITDWLPTFYAAAGGNVDDLFEDGLDGINQWPVLNQVQESARTFILLGMDETKMEAAIFQRFKLLKGALMESGGYYGESRQTSEDSSYNDNDVINSASNKAIIELGGPQISENQIKILRSNSTVNCIRSKEFPTCTTRCLFDLENDPCETEDLSTKYPKVVLILEKHIHDYRAKTVPQINFNIDTRSFPSYHNGYYWKPWIECDMCTSECEQKVNTLMNTILKPKLLNYLC